MEDENGLELSLGLSFGGSSVKPKSKNGSSSDTGADEVGRSGKMVDEFKGIFDAGPQKPDSVTGTGRPDSSKHEENFFSDLSKAKGENVPPSLNERGFWVTNNNNKPVEIKEDKQSEAGNKRKMTFDDINHQKKHESGVHHADLHDRARTPHISTEDASAAENEDVADSEAENSSSRSISQHGDGSKRFMRVGVSFDAPEDVRRVAESSVTNVEKRFTGSSEKDFKNANLTYGASFPVQQVNMMNLTYPSPVKESNSVRAPSPQISGAMHAIPTATGECSGAQPVSSRSLPVMFGYPSLQLPMLDKDNSWGLVSRPQQPHPSFAAKGPSNAVDTAAMRVISNNVSEAMPYEGRPLERSKGDGKRVTEEGSSLQPEDAKGSSTNLRAKDVQDQSTGEGSSIDFSVIKPGLAAEVKFGGCGSCPNLPWVSTTGSGSGSNGKTISGVTYRYSTNQIRIVCACHGSHMTPEEFVRHANEDHTNLEGSAALGAVANSNPASSAHR